MGWKNWKMMMADIIKFKGGRKPIKKEPPKFRYTVNWRNVTHLERMPDGGCRLFFIGGNSIAIDRPFEEADKIAKEVWGKL